MSCDKCEDIHTAQRAGKQNDECRCSCHSGRLDYQFQFDIPPQMQPCTGDPIPWQGQTWCDTQTDDTFKFKINRDDTIKFTKTGSTHYEL